MRRTAVLYADIDKLEAINEAFGLSAGDEVIQRVGTLVQQAAGAEALVCRLAGDRFAVRAAGDARPRREARSPRGSSLQ